MVSLVCWAIWVAEKLTRGPVVVLFAVHTILSSTVAIAYATTTLASSFSIASYQVSAIAPGTRPFENIAFTSTRSISALSFTGTMPSADLAIARTLCVTCRTNKFSRTFTRCGWHIVRVVKNTSPIPSAWFPSGGHPGALYRAVVTPPSSRTNTGSCFAVQTTYPVSRTNFAAG